MKEKFLTLFLMASVLTILFPIFIDYEAHALSCPKIASYNLESEPRTTQQQEFFTASCDYIKLVDLGAYNDYDRGGIISNFQNRGGDLDYARFNENFCSGNSLILQKFETSFGQRAEGEVYSSTHIAKVHWSGSPEFQKTAISALKEIEASGDAYSCSESSVQEPENGMIHEDPVPTQIARIESNARLTYDVLIEELQDCNLTSARSVAFKLNDWGEQLVDLGSITNGRYYINQAQEASEVISLQDRGIATSFEDRFGNRINLSCQGDTFGQGPNAADAIGWGIFLLVIGGIGGIAYKIKSSRSKPKLLRAKDAKEEVPTRTTWKGIVESPPPKSVEEVAKLFQEKWTQFTESSLAKYFENVGNCIIENGGALHTTDAWANKYLDMFVSNNSDGFLTRTSDGGIRLVNAEEFGRSVASDLLVDLADDLGKLAPQLKFLTFLISNFGLEMSTSYICMFVNLGKLGKT